MALFTNQAQLSYNDIVINSNIAVGEIVEVLSASKTALSDTYGRNDDVTYIISIINSGNTPFSGLTMTDDLGGYLNNGSTVYPLTYSDGSARVFVNGVLQPAPTVTAGPPLTFTNLNIPANSNLLLVYEADINSFAPLGTDGTITNTATISGGGLSTPITVSETITVSASPELTITKSIEPVPVQENGRLTYTFLIQNYGNTPADESFSATLTDVFDPVLSGLTVLMNGAVWSEPANYTYDETTGRFVTVPGQITVPAATFAQDPETGAVLISPGVSTLTVTGTI